MLSQRQRAVVWAAAALGAVWLLAWGGYTLASSRKVTAEKMRDYVAAVDLARLHGAERAKAIQRLADQLNALPLEERRRARLEGLWNDWFAQMSEEERSQFIEATLPTGFKQMITAFEELPQEKRQRAIDDSLRRLREASRNLAASGDIAARGTNALALSESQQKQVVTIGLKTFYSQSTAQTKAELAPLLEELQRQMRSGHFQHGPPRR
jgi:hypothetical protein